MGIEMEINGKTIDGVKYLTIHQIFDKVSKHLLKQNAVSQRVFDAGENLLECAYRGDNGKMCAVGCLMDDFQYKQLARHVEGKDISNGNVCHVLEASGVNTYNCNIYNMLCRLQVLHDSVQPSGWAAGLETINKDFKIIDVVN